MARHNPNNERVKRQYFRYLKEAKRQSEASVDAVAKALNRFEVHTGFRDFKIFHIEQAIAFKKYLAEQRAIRSREALSKATVHATLSALKRFFHWLASQPGYKSRLRYSDAEYFNVSGNDVRIAGGRREKNVPTLEQIKHVLASMPANTDIEMRNRALVAFTILTGARDGATASMKIKHMDFTTHSIYQDAREVHTKFRKSFPTFFFPVGDDIRQIVEDWMIYLRTDQLCGADDPLFPTTHVALGKDHYFHAAGLTRKHWTNASPIRKIFRDAFHSAGLPYYNPHSFRNTLVQLGQTVCRTPEDFKAWSQNLGHESVGTTLASYGGVSTQRQSEIIRNLGQGDSHMSNDAVQIADMVAERLRNTHRLEP